jgi:hypothetical protein
MKTFDEVRKVVESLYRKDVWGDVLWSADENEVECSFIVNDMFWWGTADGETVEASDLELLDECYSQLRAIGVGETVYLGTLYAARKRGIRPQGAAYARISKEVCVLFNLCGDHRPADFGNPVATPEFEDENSGERRDNIVVDLAASEMDTDDVIVPFGEHSSGERREGE